MKLGRLMFGMAIAMHPIAYREPRGGRMTPPDPPRWGGLRPPPQPPPFQVGLGCAPLPNPPLRCIVKGQSRRLRKVLGVGCCDFYHVGGECSWVVIKCKANPLELHIESKNELHIVQLQK